MAKKRKKARGLRGTPVEHRARGLRFLRTAASHLRAAKSALHERHCGAAEISARGARDFAMLATEELGWAGKANDPRALKLRRDAHRAVLEAQSCADWRDMKRGGSR